MNQQNKVVLVIEDDAEMYSLLRLLFRKHAFQIVGKFTGEESLAAADSLKPDLVILDIMMPGMDGWEIYQRMKLSPELKDIPIIVVTARPREIAKSYGQSFETVASYVTKPFNPRSLVSIVEQCLTTSDLERAAH